MTPVNQVILGNPLLTQEDLNSKLELMKQYEAKLMSLNKPNTIWDDIDRELKSMTDSQKRKLSENSDYVKIVSSLQEIVQDELMNLVKDKILLRNDLRKNAISARKNKAVLHYAGRYKPWEFESKDGFNEKYYYYLQKTAFADVKMPQPSKDMKGKSLTRQLLRVRIADFWENILG